MHNIVGIDPSLTRTGIATGHSGRNPTTVTTIGSTGHRHDTWNDRWLRITRLADRIAAAAHLSPDTLVAIEAPSYGSTGGSQHDRAGLWWTIYGHAARAGATVLCVPPTVRAMYATGKGNAGKDAVIASVVRRYPHTRIANDDEADALVLYALANRANESPIEPDMPKAHRRASDRTRALLYAHTPT